MPVALTAFLLAFSPVLYAQRVAVASHVVDLTADAATNATPVDAGPLPGSQPIQITLRLAFTPDQSAALDTLLAGQIDPASSSFHKWLTPAQFATSFGATDDQLTAMTAWLQSQGLSVVSVSPSHTRLTVSGTAAQIQSAFALTMHRFRVGARDHFANTTAATVPAVVAPLISGVSGLDDLPSAVPMTLQVASTSGQTATLPGTDPFTTAASAIDANTAPILTISTAACSTDLSQADYQAYTDLFRQANAQGITILASSSCGTRGSGSFPASLPQVTALALDPTASPFKAIAARPNWQAATGLPADGSRDEPDLTTSSVPAFTQALTTIETSAGARQGNINATLYSLATTPDLYTQPDAQPAGTWESSTGLGVVNLTALVKVFPRATGTNATTTALVSNSYAVTYGQPFTLTATVIPTTSAALPPSGTVTFSSATQGTVGAAALANGTAALTLGNLAVGTYSLTATYGGDSNYASSASTSSVIVTVSIATATVVATISPTNLPYGNTATVTATVTIPNSTSAPSGTVTASVEGITSAVYSATLSPNPGGNTATANIVVAAPPPNASPGYTVQVSCAGNQNFQCQAPANLTFTTTKGNTLVTVSAVPAAPQAGQPVTLSAVISNSGNGPGPYSFTGNVTFYDNGKIIASGVAIGANQASTSVTLSGGVVHSIVASYTGDSNWGNSTSPAFSVNPTLLPSTITLASNVPTALAGANIVFTATVFTTVANTVGPTGTVAFYDTFNGSITKIGTGTLVPNGPNQSIANFATTGLLAGAHSVYAIYSGDSNFTTFTSSTLAVGITDYTLTMVPQTLTLTAGQKGQVVVLLGLVGGFNGTVSFGCTPPSSTETSCSFSPVTLSGGGSTTMTIITTAATAATPASSTKSSRLTPGSPWHLATGSALATLLCFWLPRRRRAIPVMLCLLLACSLMTGLGCGLSTSSNNDPPSTPADPGSPLGTNTFTITTAGTDGVSTVRHTYQYQVTVQ